MIVSALLVLDAAAFLWRPVNSRLTDLPVDLPNVDSLMSPNLLINKILPYACMELENSGDIRVKQYAVSTVTLALQQLARERKVWKHTTTIPD